MASNLSMALSYEVGTLVLKLFYGFRGSFVVANTCLCLMRRTRTKLMEIHSVGALLEVGLRFPLKDFTPTSFSLYVFQHIESPNENL